MTECNQDRFGFASVGGSRVIVAEFSGGTISSDGGGLLLQETDSKMNLLTRFSQCFVDFRSPDLIEHSVEQLIRQRVFALALGYEDLNDHDQLRRDPLLGVMSDKAERGTELLAGKSTLNRMELGTGMPTRYKKITFWRDSVGHRSLTTCSIVFASTGSLGSDTDGNHPAGSSFWGSERPGNCRGR